MIAPYTAEAAGRGVSANGVYAEAVDYLADGAGVSRSERMVVQTLLDTIGIFSDWTMKHSVRLGLQVRELGGILGYSDHDACRFGLFASLHDAGKLGIPITLLEKPGNISRDERATIQTHVLSDFSCLDFFRTANRETARQIIRFHHENYDGTGYPDHLVRNDIPDVAQIGRICDFFDAVRSDRPYRKGMSRKETLELMQKNASAFNPEFFRAFVGNIDLIARKSFL